MTERATQKPIGSQGTNARFSAEEIMDLSFRLSVESQKPSPVGGRTSALTTSFYHHLRLGRACRQLAMCLSRRVLEMFEAEFWARAWKAFWRVSVEGQLPYDVASDLKMSVPADYKAKYRVLQ
jgi:hypothetical protein